MKQNPAKGLNLSKKTVLLFKAIALSNSGVGIIHPTTNPVTTVGTTQSTTVTFCAFAKI